MEKRVWKGRIFPGKLEAYIRMHQQIWPEMTAALNAQGIHNYTIWNYGDEVIGYYECDSLEYAEKTKKELDVCKRWSDSMQGIMEIERDQDTGDIKTYRQVFTHP